MALLAMLDQGPFIPVASPEDDAAYLHSVFGKNLSLSVENLKELEYTDQLLHIWNEARRVKWIYPDFTFDQFSFFVHTLRTHTMAWRNYSPEAYPGKITLFRAKEEEHTDIEELDLRWGEFAEGGVEVIEISGDHLSMIHKPHAKQLAKHLKECAEKVQISEVKNS